MAGRRQAEREGERQRGGEAEVPVDLLEADDDP